MAKYRFTGALNAAIFPLVSTLQSRTVIQKGLDNNVPSEKFSGSQESLNFNIPQLMYCENVVPTAEGFQSVGYQEILSGLVGATDFDQAITLRDEDENNFLFVPAGGKNYIYAANNGEWVSTNPISGWIGKLVTRAYVNGRTFICYEGLGIFEYDATLGTFTAQTISGLAGADIRGIGSSSNYLLAFTDITVHWSSLVDPLDFVPSLTTGAGSSIPQDVKARITCIVGISGGFVIYTAKNAVAAVFTNNARAPFTFKEISNAGGILSYEQVTNEQNSGPHYAWTTGGLQKITLQGAEPVSAEINDFLAGKMYETFSSTSKELVEAYDSSNEFAVKITYVSSRFLIISYAVGGSDLYNYAIFYDTILKRYGKLKIDHVDCFTYPYPNLFGDLTWEELGELTWADLSDTRWVDMADGIISDPPSKLAVAFLSVDGTVDLLRMDYAKEIQQQGVAILGKFQLTRSRMFGLQQVDFEGCYETASTDFTVTAVASLDGKTVDYIVPMRQIYNRGKISKWAKRLIGLNIWLVVEGTFALSTYMIEATSEGDK